MEFKSCAFEGRALLLADDTDFAVDGFTKSRNFVKNLDGEVAVDPLLPDTMSNSFLGDQCLESNGDYTKDHSSKSVKSASTITLNTLMESGTRFPSPGNKANDEKFATATQSKESLLSIDNSVLSSPEPKRLKIVNSQSPVPTCQVYGCNKDLSSSKDYHKRHKVCDAHSKTAVVIVNGIRQRFCQQCSRFHILAEFDEGKRSCRKRLAGHNERRRKPQINTHLGSTYFTTDASKSIIFSRILPGGFFGLQCNEPTPTSQLALDVKFSHSLPKSVLRFHGMGKQYPSKNCLNMPSSLPEFYASSDSGCALSLLSARKQNLLSNSAGMSIPHSLISKENRHANLFTAQNSATTRVETPPTSLPLEPNNLKVKSYLSPEGVNTVDLHELSFHLQRVEQQKYYGQIKMENNNFCDSTVP